MANYTIGHLGVATGVIGTPVAAVDVTTINASSASVVISSDFVGTLSSISPDSDPIAAKGTTTIRCNWGIQGTRHAARICTVTANFAWSSSNSSICEVTTNYGDTALLTNKGRGSCWIYLTYNDSFNNTASPSYYITCS